MTTKTMFSMTRRHVLATATVAALAAMTGVTPAHAADTIKVGLIASLSGPSAKSGEAITRGLTVAIDEIHAAGGLLGKHASSGRYNAGEKGWFWIASLVGLVLIISGLVLDFPIFGQNRETMEFYLVVHGIAAIIMIVASFGHIYMGTAAMEGTFEVMQTGYCDANWAKEHHDLWYEEVKQGGEAAASDAPQQATPNSEKAAT